MNTYQIVLRSNWDKVLAHIVASSKERAIYLFNVKSKTGFLDDHEIIGLHVFVTDKNGNPCKEKITIF